MTTQTSSTAALANVFVALTLLPSLSPSSTVSPIPAKLEENAYVIANVANATTRRWPPSESNWDGLLTPVTSGTSIAVAGTTTSDGADRQTTLRERLIGQLRSYRSLLANWDGEGAAEPNARSLRDAVLFVRLLGENDPLPEPMLHASGNVGLFWKDEALYADIEFLRDGRIAYYIERQGDKHKGVVDFNSKKMPTVFPVLIQA